MQAVKQEKVAEENDEYPVVPLQVDAETIEKLRQTLVDQKAPMAKRMRAVFTLRNINNDAAVDAMRESLADPSALLAHEVGYCMGQMRNRRALPYLEQTLRDESLSSMVRHEAAEAIGAIGEEASIPVLEEYKNHKTPEISETCQVSIDLILWKKQNTEKAQLNEGHEIYMSVDPAPPSDEKPKYTVSELRERLLDKTLPIFQRYRALFKLRNIGDKEAVEAICDGFEDDSALFRHEIAYVLGQIQSPFAAPALMKVLEKKDEHDMVRHEAAEALGSIADEASLPMLEQFKHDDVAAVSESCQVALDLHEYYNSDSFQYADGLVKSD